VITRTPVVIPVIVTVFEPPTPAPSPTPTPTFEPLTDKPIMGFVFKPPKEVPNTRRQDGLEIVDWLPGSSEEVLLKRVYSLETVNVLTGEVKLYATVKEPGNIWQPIWLSEAQGVTYLSQDSQVNQLHLWLGRAGGETEVLLSDIQAPLIPVEKGQGVAVYNNNVEGMQSVSPDEQNSKPAPQPVTVPLPQVTPGIMLDTAYQPGVIGLLTITVVRFSLSIQSLVK
jgi:hypothetical protein